MTITTGSTPGAYADTRPTGGVDGTGSTITVDPSTGNWGPDYDAAVTTANDPNATDAARAAARKRAEEIAAELRMTLLHEGMHAGRLKDAEARRKKLADLAAADAAEAAMGGTDAGAIRQTMPDYLDALQRDIDEHVWMIGQLRQLLADNECLKELEAAGISADMVRKHIRDMEGHDRRKRDAHHQFKRWLDQQGGR